MGCIDPTCGAARGCGGEAALPSLPNPAPRLLRSGAQSPLGPTQGPSPAAESSPPGAAGRCKGAKGPGRSASGAGGRLPSARTSLPPLRVESAAVQCFLHREGRKPHSGGHPARHGHVAVSNPAQGLGKASACGHMRPPIAHLPAGSGPGEAAAARAAAASPPARAFQRHGPCWARR